MNDTFSMIEELARNWRHIPEILVVDDDQAFCELMHMAIRMSGGNVDVATTTSSAEAMVQERTEKEKNYDLIFLDLVVPDQNGPKVLQKIRGCMPQTPVVLVTGYPNSSLIEECLKYGYLGLVQKPVDFQKLRSIFSCHHIGSTH